MADPIEVLQAAFDAARERLDNHPDGGKAETLARELRAHPLRRSQPFSAMAGRNFGRQMPKAIELRGPSDFLRYGEIGKKDGESVLGFKSFATDSKAGGTAAGDPILNFGVQPQRDAATFDELCESMGMDAVTIKQAFALNQGILPDDLFNWYSSQSFIGYQACAIISQHWLVNKVLHIPAEDAVRNGFTIATDTDEEIDTEEFAALARFDRKFKLAQNLVEAAVNNRRFGFRIVIYVVESDDPDYYRKPFNIDGVKPGSYKGMTQVDPNWIAPILDDNATANPASMNFYEPTWWLVSGQLYHRSHLELIRYVEPPDVLKPTYQYGGIPLTQLIIERVYAAERTANEAPMLVQTKRLNTLKVDLNQIVADPTGAQDRVEQLSSYRDNYGVMLLGLEDEIAQLDTSLAELDDVIMSQYQLVAAEAGVPATKLLGTSPKGFNASGDYEEKSYHEMLESLQMQLTPIVDHHHLLLIKSEFAGKFGGLDDPFEVITVWNPVGSLTAVQQAEIQRAKADTDKALIEAGAITGFEVRTRLIQDPNSGYNGLEVIDENNLELLAEFGEEEDETEEPPDDSGAESSVSDEGGGAFVSVSLLDKHTAMKIQKWTQAAGILNGVTADELHVTLSHSTKGISAYSDFLAVSPAVFDVKITGMFALLDGALVVSLASDKLVERAGQLRQMGAGVRHRQYVPHMTIKYNATEQTLARARTYFREHRLPSFIRLGNETLQPLK